MSVPIFELDGAGSVMPNTIFHRSWDKLHSRCIEYPFAASRLAIEGKILDVGSAKGDEAWLRWLATLPGEIHGVDLDPLPFAVSGLEFHRSDIRSLPFADDSFDQVCAVSVIEHIGLEDSQVEHAAKPSVSTTGDLDAFAELLRVLKPGGELIMTVPFGSEAGLFAGSARCYDTQTIERFHELAPAGTLEYFEYQHMGRRELYDEFPRRDSQQRSHRSAFKEWVFKIRRGLDSSPSEAPTRVAVRPDCAGSLRTRPGLVTWRSVPLSDACASHTGHVEGVLCGVWHKPDGSTGDRE